MSNKFICTSVCTTHAQSTSRLRIVPQFYQAGRYSIATAYTYIYIYTVYQDISKKAYVPHPIKRKRSIPSREARQEKQTRT